jgi:putative ABC transport system permease protein
LIEATSKQHYMLTDITQIIFRSISFYRKSVFYQILIIAVLSAVITGSLLTGRSVRTSLKKSAAERLGSTGIIISSGVRYFDSSVAERMEKSAGINCISILEINGYSQNLNSLKGAFNTHIFAVNNDFFKFNGNDSVSIKSGEVAVNRKLAEYLGLKPGDDLIIRFKKISDIPADAPFATEKVSDYSVVMKVGTVLGPLSSGNFSLSISQIIPMNIFINLSDIYGINNSNLKVNRLLIENRSDNSTNKVSQIFKHTLLLSDIGLKIRQLSKTGEFELISDRIFIDDALIKEIGTLLPASAPVITYLGNSFKAREQSTPYSFVSALPSSIYPEIPKGNGIIINKWMAEDLAVNMGDSVQMFWYSPDPLNKLIESSDWFYIQKIVGMNGIWSDSLLMPDFPGISGSESCSDWDAGVPLKMKDIRKKDEDYWNKYRGTPKAFINYETGKKLWENNFGPATSLRFPEGLTKKDIEEHVRGSLDPDKAGFVITDLFSESVKAANESVDFGTLFLSLGFFLILASIVLLSFAVTSYLDTKRAQINTLFALGFKSGWIKQMLFIESGIIALTGSITGAFAGYLVNIVITRALNSVWMGATQTDTLDAFFSLVPLITGFVITITVILFFMFLKINRYLKMLNRKEKEVFGTHSPRRNFLLLIISALITISLYALSLITKDHELSFCFGAGTLLLITLILFWRQYFIGWSDLKMDLIKTRNGLSRLYYSFYPSNAVTPILFIASGVFAVFITGANKMNSDEKNSKRSDGTGGYLLWCENTIPVKEDMNTTSGRKALGLDSEQLAEISFVQVKRSSGDDASCLNLNHVTSPPLLGIDPSDFITKGSFFFSKVLKVKDLKNPWQFLNIPSENNVIYGIADQTVLEWGLKVNPGDTLIIRSENGQPLNIIIAAGLQASVFQGYVLIGLENFTKYYPSVSGSSVLLVDGDKLQTDLYKSTLNERFNNYGINIEKTTERLAVFNEVTNTYLSVFGVFGALGMITGIAGLGFVMLKNYNHRKREFAMMLATGFPFTGLRRMILSEQVLILIAGVSSGVISAIVATLPSLKNSPDIPWIYLFFIISAIFITGLFALILSVRAVTYRSLTASLKKD